MAGGDVAAHHRLVCLADPVSNAAEVATMNATSTERAFVRRTAMAKVTSVIGVPPPGSAVKPKIHRNGIEHLAAIAPESATRSRLARLYCARAVRNHDGATISSSAPLTCTIK
jgi:hypothetical protein